MPEVAVTQRLRADPSRVWRVLCDMEGFPRFMSSVERVTVVERGEGYTVSEWVCRLQGMKFRWTERDEFLPGRGRIDYRLVSGDLAQFEGAWQLDPIPAGAGDGEAVSVTLTTRFDFGLPMLSAMLDPVGKVMLRRNVEAMLRGLEGEMERDSGH